MIKDKYGLDYFQKDLFRSSSIRCYILKERQNFMNVDFV